MNWLSGSRMAWWRQQVHSSGPGWMARGPRCFAIFAMLRLVGSVIFPIKGISFADIWHPWVSAGIGNPISWETFWAKKGAFV